MRVSTALLAVALLSGCASMESTPPEAEAEVAVDPAEGKIQRVNRGLSVDWDNMGRGGAAMRQPAYIHVLGESSLQAASNNIQNVPSGDAGQADGAGARNGDGLREALSTLKDLQQGKGYSLYELSRWERFCNKGHGMDERDWRFVESEGADNVPTTLQVNCSPPTFTYGDYLTAWTRFCTHNEPSQADRQIVRVTVRPQSAVNPCAALQ